MAAAMGVSTEHIYLEQVTIYIQLAGEIPMKNGIVRTTTCAL